MTTRKRATGKPFRKGKKKTGGRTKGTENKATRAIREIARGLTLEDPAYLKGLRARLRKGREPAPVVVLLLHYGWGVPKQSVDLTAKVTLEEIVAGTKGT